MVADGPRREIIITGQHTKSNTLLFDHDLLNYMEPIFLPLCSLAIAQIPLWVSISLFYTMKLCTATAIRNGQGLTPKSCFLDRGAGQPLQLGRNFQFFPAGKR